MKKVLLILPALALAACAPAASQGQKPMRYQATSAQIISAIAEVAPTMTAFAGKLNVVEITPNQITLENPTTFISDKFSVVFTALESNGTTLVTHAYKGADIRVNSPIDKNVRDIYTKLALKYPTLP